MGRYVRGLSSVVRTYDWQILSSVLAIFFILSDFPLQGGNEWIIGVG